VDDRLAATTATMAASSPSRHHPRTRDRARAIDIHVWKTLANAAALNGVRFSRSAGREMEGAVRYGERRNQRAAGMTAQLRTLRVRSRRQWRAWLAKHHTSCPGVWLVFYKAHTGVKSIRYEDMVREALCFGWIDSLVKRVDDDRYTLKVTPRQPTSKWSDINRKRWAELDAAGLLTPAGLAAAPTDNTYAPRPKVPVLPAYIGNALKADASAWEFFRKLAPTHRRDFVVWIHLAKRPETRARRIRESIRLLAAGKKLGLK
jgi:uncharacterized protein YdeI (YjbR/CyaY-like superfamily)